MTGARGDPVSPVKVTRSGNSLHLTPWAALPEVTGFPGPVPAGATQWPFPMGQVPKEQALLRLDLHWPVRFLLPGRARQAHCLCDLGLQASAAVGMAGSDRTPSGPPELQGFSREDTAQGSSGEGDEVRLALYCPEGALSPEICLRQAQAADTGISAAQQQVRAGPASPCLWLASPLCMQLSLSLALVSSYRDPREGSTGPPLSPLHRLALQAHSDSKWASC